MTENDLTKMRDQCLQEYNKVRLHLVNHEKKFPDSDIGIAGHSNVRENMANFANAVANLQIAINTLPEGKTPSKGPFNLLSNS